MENLIHIVGGGSTIGTSCYYVQVDGHRFLLDCGATLTHSPHIPALHELNQYLDGLWQLDAVVLSHAHFDHVGALPYMVDIGESVPILCNPITERLTRLQLCQFDGLGKLFRSARQRQQYELQKDHVLNQLKPQGFGVPYEGNGFRITLYRAGHIPGAAMVYIETEGHRILYSGDFSSQPDLLCGSYGLPEHLPVDVLLCEGTHLYGPHRSGYNRPGYEALALRIAKRLKWKDVTVTTGNVTKGIELARYLATVLPERHGIDQPIYLGHDLLPIANAFEDAHYQVFSPRIQPLPQCRNPVVPHELLITRYGSPYAGDEVLNGDDFTLHASQQDIYGLIRRAQAPTTLIVHATPPYCHEGVVVIPDYGGQCIQADDGQGYYFT